MSQLIISRLCKPSLSRNFLRRTNVRLFSCTSGSDSDDDENRSFLSRPAYPFLLIDHLLNNPDSPDGGLRKRYGNLDCPKVKALMTRNSRKSSIWIDVKTTPRCIDPLSNLIFSQRDQRFYTPSPGGNYLCYLDECDELEFLGLLFDDLPKSVSQELAEVSSCSRTDHLVDSPTGELFLVKWYSEDSEQEEDNDSGMATLMPVTKKFMVFREGLQSSEYEKTMIYTEDIGDLCIFLGHSEAYCVPASSSPGLRPNCIYFVGRNFGVYDLTTKNCTNFYKKDGKPITRTSFPYWPSPVPL
ncbi:unnamed protein product [Microthlaspi erraticum]|uniref:KIB1-4 beta-propeller domain-containing protein n=1 Tax=Microthlaspi erraticum TaxID=1685480 RepID=A0A6D2L3Q9_9BRAS|nr:unnamed protein product [Microthlaspi erraticum]